jgi:membrane protease subunit HflK
MAWNEPGNGKDPWKRDDNEPNDLDQIVQQWQRRLGSLLGGGGGKSPGGAGGFVLIILVLLAWAATGIYRVDEAERGVVQRFGAYTQTTMPGLHWHLPYPIESVDVVNTVEINNFPFRTEILTADEQYVFIQMVVQYRRDNPVDYSFEVVDPESTVKDVTESALREVIGTNDLEDLVTGDRDEIARGTLRTLQETLNDYKSGIIIASVNISSLDYPQAVQAAVNDTQKATNDSARFRLEAETYRNDIVPRARGDAARIREDAEAYQERVIRDAEGQANRFVALLEEYEKAPRVTRDRLYIDAIEEVYGNSNKVLIDSQGSGNLLYLPIDKIIQGQQPRTSSQEIGGGREQNSFTPDDRTAESPERERRTRQ